MSNTEIKHVSALQAWDILQHDAHAVLLDVRTRMEYEYVGHASNALHVAWIEAPTWCVDENFALRVSQQLTQDQDHPQSMTIVAICRSGKRSLAALEELARHGFTKLYNIADGFEGELDENGHRGTINGWRAAQLPWRQS